MTTLQKAPKKETAELAHLRDENARLNQQLGGYQAQIDQLQVQLDWFKQQLFGQKSERRPREVHPDQLSLADVLELETPITLPADQLTTVTYERGRAKKDRGDAVNETGLRFDDSVPVETIELQAPELTGPDADQYEVVDQKLTYRLAQRPGSYVILQYTRPVVKHKADLQLITTPAPANVFDPCTADVSVLAGLLVDKFAYHCPLYRQHQKLQMAGITVSRATLTNWVQRSITLLTPIYHAQLKQILQSKTLAMDETPIKAGRKHRGKMRTAYFWPIYGDGDEIAFTYASSRAQQHVLDQLKGFQGTLLTDGYVAYQRYADKTREVTHASCWAHARRTFVKAEQIEPDAVAEALSLIGQLYQIEAQINDQGLTGEKKQKVRTEQSLPVVDAFFAWCDQQRQRLDLVNSNPLAKALTYVTEREHQLRVFLSDPDVQVDTNHLERALRVIPMGRKNWLFAWTEIGAEQIGIIQSLLVTCRLHDINPYTYLVDVLQRVSVHPASKVAELTPINWKQTCADNPMQSDLDKVRQ
jgi:transposase